MVEFRGVVNINKNGEVVCFCSHEEAMRGECACKIKDDCPDAIISVEVIPGTRPSEKGISKVTKATKTLEKDVNRIKEGLSRLERAVKNSKFRI